MQQYVGNLDITDFTTYFQNLPLVERLLGMENTYVPVKLFSLAIVMSLTNLQQKFLKYSYLTDMLKIEDKKTNNTLKPQTQSKFKLFVYKFKTIIIFLASYLIKPVPSSLLVLYAAKNPCMLSFTLLVIILA